MNKFGVTYDNLRGTNYLFNSSLQKQADFSLFSSPLDATEEGRYGTYSRANVVSELAYLAASGFNNLRIWPPFFGWIIDRVQFRDNLTHFVEQCRDLGLTLTWAFWNGVGNGILWESRDLIEFTRGATGDVTNEGLYKNLETLTQVFQDRHGQWVPRGKPWHLTGYPAPGNNLLESGGDPESWSDRSMRDRVHGFVDELLDVIQTDAGRDTLFQIDLVNELDGVGISLHDIVDFLDWNQTKVRLVLPEAPLTVGWAFHDVPRYAKYVAAMADRRIEVSRHSFHVYVREPAEYESRVTPLLEWGSQNALPLMVTEFYRTDIAEWGRLRVGLEFFERHHIPTIMWGFINSNIYDDPDKPGNQGTPHLDGVVSATNLEFNVEYRFESVNDADYRAVLDYNERQGVVLG
jgi:hypothetical protein